VKTGAITRWTLGAFALALATAPRAAEACAACFGRSDSPMAQGMNMGILSLLIVIVSVLFGIALFFGYILRRAARLAREQAGGQASATTSVEFREVLTRPISQPTR